MMSTFYFDMLFQRASSQLEAQQIVYITANFHRLNFVQLMKCQRCTYQAEHTETYRASKCTCIGIPIYWRRVKNLLMSLLYGPCFLKLCCLDTLLGSMGSSWLDPRKTVGPLDWVAVLEHTVALSQYYKNAHGPRTLTILTYTYFWGLQFSNSTQP